jgi:ApbE superfamily uncharacterized protein (UPF0280 family)
VADRHAAGGGLNVQGPTRQRLPGGRLQWRHGPIDLVIGVEGEAVAVERACAVAWQRFATVLAELVGELHALRQPVVPALVLRTPVARRMLAACRPFAADFITPMAAVAGSVADEITGFFAIDGIERAWVNNGGDIAFHLAPGRDLRLGLVADAYAPGIDAHALLRSADGVRGVATSGWRGRSFSLGIADSVTVLARSAAQADAAATMIANAVDVDHPAIERARACDLKDDTDLGELWVTRHVGALPVALVEEALDQGQRTANAFLARGLIAGAAIALQGRWRTIGAAASVEQALAA